MSHWPDRCGPGDARILNASLTIPDGAKRVWMEQWVLDVKGLGCWLTHDQLGERLGMTARSVETYRLRLEAHECCARLKELGVRAHGWRSTLPDHCRMRSQRPSPSEVARFRQYLDRHVGEWAKPARGDPETRAGAEQDPQNVSSKPAPVRVSRRASTAFDSQADSNPSTALAGKGSREMELEARRAEERPRAEVEAEGWERIRRAKAKSPERLGSAVTKAFEESIKDKTPEEQRILRRRAYGL